MSGNAGAAQQVNHVRTAIYGSCVSRDTFEYLTFTGFSLHSYLARQSLISAYCPPTPHRQVADFDRLPSPFQRRMAEKDFGSSLPSDLDDLKNKADLLLWDLMDERLGVFEIAENRYVTRTVELMSTGLADSLARDGRYIPFGSDEHFELWCERGLRPFVTDLDSSGLQPKTLLLAVPWALVDERGEASGRSFGTAPDEANALYERYLSAIPVEVSRVHLGLGDVTSSSSHKWGRAPFHYSPATYQAIARKVARFAEGLAL